MPVRKSCLYLTNYLAFSAFYPLHGKVNKHCFSSNWYSAKTANQFSSAMHFTTSANRTPESPSICLYCNYYGPRNKAGALIKIANYAKGVIQQTGRHTENILMIECMR